MKTILRLISITTILTSVAFASGFVYAETEMLYTEKGYPYKNLVDRSEQVKIIYSKVGTGIDCRVEVELDGTTWKTDNIQVNQQDFDTAPLSSCLNRDKAKQMLASTFAS